MRGKFVLAKHGQIYEPAGLPGAALTTDINTRALRGGCITWGNRDANPNMVASEEELSQAARPKDAVVRVGLASPRRCRFAVAT